MTSPAAAATHAGQQGAPAATGARDAPLPLDSGALPLDLVERRQLGRLRRWGTVGALLMMVGTSSSYGAATPIPNPVDGIRILGLLSRIGPAALACSYSGIGLLVLCWFLIGRFARPGRARRLTRTQISHTLVMWSVPFLVTPPVFSRDVYSYLAVGAMLRHGDNPYASGPYDTLGDGNALAHQVDARWQHTSSPYGPAFLLVMRGVVTITGDHVILGVLLQRLVELAGVALIVWALPRLARRCGIEPVSALWLGALNPLLLFHLIAGGHNEALMLGTMLSGLVIALGPPSPLPTEHVTARRRPRWHLDRQPDWVRVGLGSAVISAGVAVKATAGIGLAFLVIALALRAGGRWRDLWQWMAVVGGSALGAFGLLTAAAGVGFGWVSALTAPGSVQSFLSVSTALALGAGQLGLLLGLGDHTQAAVSVMQTLGTGVGALLAFAVMWRCWRPRRTRARGRDSRWAGHSRSAPHDGQPSMTPIQGLGVALGAFILLGPVIQPWYLLWAALPLAASTGPSQFRRVTVWLTAVFAVIIMPNGATIPVFIIIQTVAVAALVLGALLMALSRRGLPRRDPPIPDGARAGPGWQSTGPAPPGAYPG